MGDGRDTPQNILDPVAPGEVVQTQAKLVRRRLILKGLAAGVPAIITLQGASSAAAAVTSTGVSCITGNGITDLTNYGGARCVTSAVAGNSIIQRYNSTSSVWSGSPPCTSGGATYGAIYSDASGVAATANAVGSGFFGGVSKTGNPSGGYYAVTISCWGSFH